MITNWRGARWLRKHEMLQYCNITLIWDVKLKWPSESHHQSQIISDRTYNNSCPTRNAKLHVYCQKDPPFKDTVTLKSLFTSFIFLAITFNVICVYFFTKHFINTVSTYLHSKVCFKQAAQLWLRNNVFPQHFTALKLTNHY